MKAYLVKFGGSGDPDGSYSDDTKIAAIDFKAASLKAWKISERRIRQTIEAFEVTKGDKRSEEEQRAEWIDSAKESNEVTSLIFQGDLEEP